MATPVDKVTLTDAFGHVAEHWSPRIVGELNGQHVKIAKAQGEFIWHHHEHEDELFYVVKGRLLIRFRDRDVTLDPGDMIIVPKGVEHQPVAEEEVWVMLFEPATTLNTGNVRNERTVETLERL